MESILIYVDTNGGAMVLESSGPGVETLHKDSYNMEDWPEDLGVYEKSGLVVWEGEVTHNKESDDFTFNGKLRDLTKEEWGSLTRGEWTFR